MPGLNMIERTGSQEDLRVVKTLASLAKEVVHFNDLITEAQRDIMEFF